MLTNLNWLEEGKEYPPKLEVPRIVKYINNEALFNTEHHEAWKGRWEELAKRLKRKASEVETIFNYHQLVSKKTADFVCGELPTIMIGKEKNDEVTKVLRQQMFFSKLYEGIIDVSRFGNGIPKIVGKRMTTISAKYWYPVVDPTDLKQITQHVIAYPTELDDKGMPSRLYVEIHSIGALETRIYNYSPYSARGAILGDSEKGGIRKGKIGRLVEESRTEMTGLDDFAVQPLTNITHSGSIYGLDDYAIINSLVEKIMWRLACADLIMDKHSEPSISGPESALTWDEKHKMYYLDLANYFKRKNKDDPDVSYITWDGGLESNFKEIDLLFNQLYILSEMGAAFLEGNDSGSTSSGTALKLRLVSPRIKAQRLTGLNDASVRKLIQMLAQVNGIEINPDDLQLVWNDGLPDDPVEDANRWNVETGGKPTKSQRSAIKERGLTDEETDAELEQMRLETVVMSAAVLGVVDPTEENDGEEGLDAGRNQ